MLNHDTLGNFYKTTFAMIQHHKYSLSEIEQMLPFERNIYIDMLEEYIEKMSEKD